MRVIHVITLMLMAIYRSFALLSAVNNVKDLMFVIIKTSALVRGPHTL